MSTVVGATVSLLQYPAIVIIDGPGNGNPYWVSDRTIGDGRLGGDQHQFFVGVAIKSK